MGTVSKRASVPGTVSSWEGEGDGAGYWGSSTRIEVGGGGGEGGLGGGGGAMSHVARRL